MKKFVYKNKKTGEKIFSDVELKDKNLVLVLQTRNGMMKNKNIRQK